ncbi:hypothetical protein GSI_01428 [Ganoderma sinense ZZ0214-1]|uniref:Uncharacterized protein n=1 Tax=Ganoderma sinense ZZ0214-1 TaxID=1077348 RepID=A0A2G8SVE7_9APHY|nr:hypothetical protein GSI_01428 [Ganoderma sinense ZZ0214-1]
MDRPGRANNVENCGAIPLSPSHIARSPKGERRSQILPRALCLEPHSGAVVGSGRGLTEAIFDTAGLRSKTRDAAVRAPREAREFRGTIAMDHG